MFLIQSLLYAIYESHYQRSLLTKEDPHPSKNYGSLAIFRGYMLTMYYAIFFYCPNSFLGGEIGS